MLKLICSCGTRPCQTPARKIFAGPRVKQAARQYLLKHVAPSGCNQHVVLKRHEGPRNLACQILLQTNNPDICWTESASVVNATNQMLRQLPGDHYHIAHSEVLVRQYLQPRESAIASRDVIYWNTCTHAVGVNRSPANR